MTCSYSDIVAYGFYSAGMLTSIASVSYGLGADDPDPHVQASGISATFLLSVVGGTVRAWANPQTSMAEKVGATAALLLLTTSFVANINGASKAAFFSTASAGGCIGFWNQAMVRRVTNNTPASNSINFVMDL